MSIYRSNETCRPQWYAYAFAACADSDMQCAFISCQIPEANELVKPREITKYLVQRATAVQLRTPALSVRVSYQSANNNTVPCGIYSTWYSHKRDLQKQCQLLPSSELLYVLRTQPKNTNYNAEFSLQQTADVLSYRFPIPNNIFLFI